MKRLGISAAVVSAVWVGLQFHPQQRNDPIDMVTVIGIGVTMVSAVLVMVLFTRTWSSRGIGVLLTTLGTGVLYSAATYARLSDKSTTPEWLIDLARACYLVGAPLFLFGLAVWVWQRIVLAREVANDPAPPDAEDIVISETMRTDSVRYTGSQ